MSFFSRNISHRRNKDEISKEGVIFSNADPIQIAKDYESAGAVAISVLTDRLYFEEA